MPHFDKLQNLSVSPSRGNLVDNTGTNSMNLFNNTLNMDNFTINTAQYCLETTDQRMSQLLSLLQRSDAKHIPSAPRFFNKSKYSYLPLGFGKIPIFDETKEQGIDTNQSGQQQGQIRQRKLIN
jgi:hypothetical protein